MIVRSFIMKNIDELKKQLENDNALILRYRVQEEIYHKKANAINFETMKMALNEVGIYLDIKDGELVLSLHKYKYLRRKTRNAGTKKQRARGTDGSAYKYSDILSMQQTMKDTEILETTGMTSATYYRHKKAMKESAYYKRLDKTKLNDAAYLKSIEGDTFF